MPKFSIYLMALLSFYCYGIQIFSPTVSRDKINENKVRLGEEFIVQFTTKYVSKYWKFFNKDEVSDSIQLLRIGFERRYSYARFSALRVGYVFDFYFKAIKVTNKAKILKFYFHENHKNYIIKVNVY